MAATSKGTRMARDKDKEYKQLYHALYDIIMSHDPIVRTSDDMYHNCLEPVGADALERGRKLLMELVSADAIDKEPKPEPKVLTGNPFIDAMGPDSFADNSKWAGACGYTPSI